MPYKDPDKQREYQRNRYHERRVVFIEKLGGRCRKCGSQEDLEFDHINPKEKEFYICHRLASANMQVLEKEIDKCQLLCHTCHADKNKIDLKREITAKHGTHYMYRKYRCRCKTCVVGNSIERKKWKR